MDEKLIELVRAHEELYDVSNRRYGDNLYKEKTWNRIAEELNKPRSECKQRWVSLRDQYRRSLRKSATKRVRLPVNKGKYMYADEMSFVRPFLRERGTATNLANDELSVVIEDVEAAEEDDVVPQKNQKCNGGVDQSSIGEKWATKKPVYTPSQRSMKPSETVSCALMKYLVENHKEEKSTDPIELFFQTMAATVKKFSPYYQNMCKTKVFSVVSEFEMTQVLENKSPAASATLTPGHTTVPAVVKSETDPVES